MRWAFICLALTGCAVGAPPGFSKGESWSFPLVAPLEDDLLLVPVYVGTLPEPVLFMIDPDSATSSIDSGLQADLKAYTVQGPHQLNERDRRVPVFIAEVKKIRIGELEVDNIRMRVHKAGTFWAGGRRVRGILGRDILADSLMFSIDRDRGMGMLATQDSLSPPPQAQEIHFRNFFHRRIAKVKINQRNEVDMHLDLGARTSMLWASEMQKLGLPKLNVRAELQDEYGTTWQENTGGLAAMIEVGGARVDAVVVLPYGDRRVDDQDLDGALGQNFFSRFNVMVNWHEKTFWLKRRSGDIIGTSGERLRRWGKAFEGCARPACMQIQLVRGEAAPGSETGPQASGVEPQAGQASGAQPTPAPAPSPTPGATPTPTGGEPLREIRIVREPRAANANYEVLLEAVRSDGESLGLPRLRVTLKSGVELSETQLAPQYSTAAAFLVLDASPFPRACEPGPAGERCVWQQVQK
ncbi:MAG TPA: retropepsin-like aspartic protease [Kofleriaceae bacterium]|nr:retropepsin-like aspartic protease [Kofleriaceae bacterium]